MNFDELLRTLGEFGLYQKRVYFLICLLSVSSGVHTVISVFLLGIPDHRCKIPGYPNDTYAIQSEYHRDLVNATIPTKKNSDGDLEYKPCTYFMVRDSNASSSKQEQKCEAWVYDKSIYETTFASEQNLVCDKEIWTTNASMIFFGGVLVGAILLGYISDMYGRRNVMMVSIFVTFCCTLGLAWAPSFAVYCTLRFVIGIASAGLYMTGFVLGIELVGPSKRVWAGIVIALFFALGLVLLAAIAYGLRDWKYLEIACSAPNGLFLLYWWFIPESPRWLMDKGRHDEAKKIIQKVAKENNVDLSVVDLDKLQSDTQEDEGKIWHLMKSRVLFLRSLVIFFNWMVVSIAYYGLSLNSGNLAGDFYLNFFLVGLVEFPAYTMCLVFLDRIGRKKLHVTCMIVGGAACLLTIFTILYLNKAYQWVTVVLALIGKAGAAAAYAIIYVWTAELFPTVVRNAGMGASSFCANVGGVVAPYISDMGNLLEGDVSQALPLVLFGGLSLLAGLLSLVLPETLGLDLPETISDAHNFGRKPSNTYELKEKCQDMQDIYTVQVKTVDEKH